ncbi:MAG: FAD-containing monooxygenase EthA [Acidimicrobiales bacterium mtb01]|nr:NAD(P)/FAD-dependent oxidoreductase [Actinomycetota bacterium]TEX48264.1 MAG: FAD-containing monooxygenase EthA [Acidimicrobiales bacterium mtb01]
MMTTNHFDVLIVGAGISGIGSAYHLKTLCPDRSFAILEGRPDIGGTWDLFRYPGVRSDSDMHTLGYSFKPWTDAKAIADGPSIMKYLRATVQEFGIAPHIKFNHLVSRAEWSTESATWTLTAKRADTGETVMYTCNFLHMCSGYYSYKEGYTPEFPGRERFRGTIIHPQKWPENFDYSGKRVVVVGSGATAMTVVPAMADKAAHVTMLQRSPTYVVARPDVDRVAEGLRKIFPEKVAYAITRKKNTVLQGFFYGRTRTQPEKVKATLLAGVRQALGPNFDVDKHFTPSYNPWDQRMCLLTNGDLFKSINAGRASVVTDHIETFTENGIRLKSGDELEADVIVTATGLNLVTLGEMTFEVDGEVVDFAKTWTYRGVAYSDVPNLVSTFGYINASWTLRADLVSTFVCRLLNHMRDNGTVQVTPRLRPSDRDMTPRPWIEQFSAGYMQRTMDQMPKQGDREPWVNPQSFKIERKTIGRGRLDDGVLQFTRQPVRESVSAGE